MRCRAMLLVPGIFALVVSASRLPAQVLSNVRLAVFGGPAFRTGAASRPYQLGLALDGSLMRLGTSQTGVGFLVEGGVFHPSLSGTGSYFASTDVVLDPFRDYAGGAGPVRPFAVAGYTRLFLASSTTLSGANAVNFGVGSDRVLHEDLWLRVEVRDQYVPSSDSHALTLRVGLVGLGSIR